MKVKLIEADQMIDFIYWNTQTNKYDTITCSVIEYLHCYCDVSKLDIYSFERSYDERTHKEK